MVATEFINELKAIYNKSSDYYIMGLYMELNRINSNIINHINDDSKLLDDWKVELETLYYEGVYGDNDEYTDLVIEDCMTVLNQIIKKLEGM